MKVSFKKFLATILLAGFFFWIIPLGAFIEAHQEGLICNGRRAVCLCTHSLKKKAGEAAHLTLRRPKRQTEPSVDSPTFGGHMLASHVKVLVPILSIQRLNNAQGRLPLAVSSDPPEPVPKTA